MQYNFHIYNQYQWVEVKLVFGYKYVAEHNRKVCPGSGVSGPNESLDSLPKIREKKFFTEKLVEIPVF